MEDCGQKRERSYEPLEQAIARFLVLPCVSLVNTEQIVPPDDLSVTILVEVLGNDLKSDSS